MGLSFFIYCGVLSITCITVFSQTSKSTISKWKNEETINGTNPGLAFIPVPADNQSTLIWTNATNYRQFSENLMKFLDIYYNPPKIQKGNVTLKECSYDELPKKDQVCAVDVRIWGPCIRERYFDYYRNSPCVFLKLHTINGWVPEYYNDPSDLPEDMPHHLRERIRGIERPEERNKVWITCSGEYPVDVEYLGPVSYYPYQGFPAYYFPYMGTKGYLSPLVAVKFERPSYGVVMNIECRAWAKNIKYDRNDRSGLVHFELLVD